MVVSESACCRPGTCTRLYEDLNDTEGHRYDLGVVGGLRAGFYVKDISRPVRSVGALLEPGASPILFGVPAGDLAGRHTSLEDLWGAACRETWEKMREAPSLSLQLDLFERFLATRLPRVTGIHPAVAHALSRLSPDIAIGDIVEETGYSHRRFIALFRESVGLPPRLYCRVMRFQHVLKAVAKAPLLPWAELALEGGYADQAHFNREFREFAGISPGQYRASAGAGSHHVPVLPAGGSISFNTSPRQVRHSGLND